MESKKKIRKHAPTSSSSSDDDDSSTSSSSSSDNHHKKHRSSKKQRDSSSSSDGEFVRKTHKHQHKKSAVRKHSHSAKIRAKMVQTNVKKTRSMSPATRAAHKHHLKLKLAKKAKQLEEHDRHSARRSRTPVRRDVKKERTPEHRINSPTTRIRVSVPNNRVQDRAALRSVKDSPSTSRRYVREAIDERGDIMMRQKEHEKMRRMPEEEHYKYSAKVPERASRVIPPTRMTPDKYHRERSRSHGRIPIRERLDKEFEYRRSNSRERDDYPIGRNSGNNPREHMDRPYEYRQEDRRNPNHEYGQSSRPYEDRHHRWEDSRGNEPETRGNRIYEGGNSGNKNWEPPIHERKRIPDDVPYKERQWNENSGPPPHDKWAHKDKEPQDWKRGSWKDQQSSQVAPTMPHPRRWPGPNQMSSDTWNSPRGPPPHKMDSHPSSGPPFKPRGGAPYFGFKRFPYKRFPNQYSKINFPSKRVLPSAATSQSHEKQDDPRTMGESLDNNIKFSIDQQQADNLGNESGELTTETEEEKIAQPDTTFSGTIDPQEECEGNLSEFSDVDDEILNREEIGENSSSHLDVQIQSQSSCTTSTASRAHNRIAYVNNRIFSPFSSDYYCIYGLLPRHADDDVGKCELARASAQENQQQQRSSESQIQNDQYQEESTQDPNAQKMISKIHANKELKKEMDLDFEEISDGEFEQESALKGFGDALGVDWASLAKETQRPMNKLSEDFYNTTKSRWSAHRILWDIGISVKFAGEDFARRTMEDARNQLREEKHEWRLKKNQQLKDEKMAMNGDIKKEKVDGIKVEPEDEEDEDPKIDNDDQEDFELENDVLNHPLAQVQVLMRKLAIKRKNLILNSTGKYGRALSARKDLKLRRQLCNLPAKDVHIDRNCTSNSEINKHADEIYRKLVEGIN
ncbi:hypothetical protein ACKWTF_005501 [Chironomus riparius]